MTSASTEPLSERFTHTDTTAEAMSGYIVAVRGANPVTPEDAPAAHGFGLDPTNPADPSVTTVSPNALVLWHEGVTGRAVNHVEGQRGSALLQTTKGTNRNSGVSALLEVTPGPTFIGHWGNPGATSGAAVHTFTVAVRPL